MIIEIWITIFLLSAFLLFLGYQYGAELTIIVGFGFIFILGAALAITGIEYSAGHTETANYTYILNTTTIDSINTTNTTTRDNYRHSTMGLLLATIGGLGAANVIYNGRG